jgi:hypothetical protein
VKTTHIRELIVFALLGALIFCSFKIIEQIPGVQTVALMIAAYTLVYRVKALAPIYVYVMLYGVTSGFANWWLPYLYIWLPLWGAFLLLPKALERKKYALPIYAGICALHGICFGLLYAPAQALMFGLSFNGTIAWIAAGLPFDIAQAVNNLFMGLMILPLAKVIRKADRRTR